MPDVKQTETDDLQQATTEDVQQKFDELKHFYANNVRFETSGWDLKLLFGQLQQHGGQAHIEWHTAMTLPWRQAKLMSYFLQLNLALYESNNGKIHLPESMVPVAPAATDERTEKVKRLATELLDEMFG